MLTTQQQKAIRLVVILLVASVATGVVFAALTLIFRHDILAYQEARQPHADPGELARTLWTRPIPVLLIAILYVRITRQFSHGVRRAYQRIRIVSIVGLVAVGWLLLSGAYPVWLRTVEVVQLVLLAAVVVAVHRPVVRSAFPKVPDRRPRNRRAALLLAVLAPVVAELSLGSVPLRLVWVVVPLYVPIYGAGALFIREVVRRTGGGVANLLLMGVAYGLVEEGLALQSLTSPHIYGAAEWAPRLFGLNTAYTELNLVYHAVFSVTIPVLLVERAYGRTPYLRRGGVVAAGVIALSGAALVRVSIAPAEDPGYTMPVLATVLIVAAIALLVVVGLRFRLRPAEPVEPPRPLVVAAVTGGVAFAFLALLWPFAGAKQPMFTHGAWAFVPMAIAGLMAIIIQQLLRRWRWTSGRVVAACFGALVGHTAFGLVGNADTLVDRLFLAVLCVVTIVVGVVAVRRSTRTTTTAAV